MPEESEGVGFDEAAGAGAGEPGADGGGELEAFVVEAWVVLFRFSFGVDEVVRGSSLREVMHETVAASRARKSHCRERAVRNCITG